MVSKDVLLAAAEVVGWGYFVAWTVSFLPQIYENCRRRSAVGLSFDMVAYFMLSYITYGIYNTVVFFDTDIQHQIIGQTKQSNPVKFCDFIFAAFAFLCQFIQCVQCIVLERGSQKVHISTTLLCCFTLVALAVLSIVAYFKLIAWLLVLNYCGYVKMVVSFGTYLPQIVLNYQRKCTEGYHIGGVLLDFTGGVLSLLQMDIYCFIEHSNKQFTGNIPKMALAIVTLIFNIILIIQHYVLYMGNTYLPASKDRPSDCAERTALIESGSHKLYHSVNAEENDGCSINSGEDTRSLMARDGKECLCYQKTKDVWRPSNSVVSHSNPLSKVDVAFASPFETIDIFSPSLSQSPMKDLLVDNPCFVSPTKELMEKTVKDKVIEDTVIFTEKVAEKSPQFYYTFEHGNPSTSHKAYYINMASHVTPGTTSDDEMSPRCITDNDQQSTPLMTPRKNILSHMAKNKVSWVESTVQQHTDTCQRKSPILIKGKNPNTFETPYEKSQKIKDCSTKGVRDGHRFDLLPISKYLAQYKREGLHENETKLPLVRISSVQKIQVVYHSSQGSRPMHKRQRFPQTFFAERDMFKPRESRSRPTRGEAAFVDIREQLPRLYKKQYNAPVVKMGQDVRLIGTGNSGVLLPSVY